MNIGYVRVSTTDQNPDRQIQRMIDLDIENRYIFVDKASGKNFDRPQYQAMKVILRAGDVLYVDSLDRLGRNYDGIISEWKEITREIGADVVALDKQDVFDSRKFREMGDLGKLLEDQMLSMMAWVAEQERKKILERQAAGIAIAKAQGKYKGRKKIVVDPEQFDPVYREVLSGGRTNKWAMEKLGLKRNVYFNAVKEFYRRHPEVEDIRKHCGNKEEA